jgi:hypothetical protein
MREGVTEASGALRRKGEARKVSRTVAAITIRGLVGGGLLVACCCPGRATRSPAGPDRHADGHVFLSRSGAGAVERSRSNG